MQIGRRNQHGRDRLRRIHLSHGNPLNLDALLTDHPRRRLHGRQRASRPRRPLHIQEAHARTVRRISRRLHGTLQLGQPPRRAPIQPRQVQVCLLSRLATIGEERQFLCIWSPRNLVLVAMLLRLGRRRHPLALLQVIERRHANLPTPPRTLHPGQLLPIRRNRHLPHKPTPVQPFQDLFDMSPIRRLSR